MCDLIDKIILSELNCMLLLIGMMLGHRIT